MTFNAVVVAAGAGARAGPGTAKQWRTLAGRPIVRWSVEAFLAAGAETVIVVIPAGDESVAEAALAGLPGWTLAVGAATRAQSTLAGLRAVPADGEATVMVHDAARPFLAPRHVMALLAALPKADGAIPVLPVADTLKYFNEDAGVVTTASREGLWRAQTPQAFRLGRLREAYDAWDDTVAPTDDAGVVERSGGRIALTPGDPMLMKLTYPEDFEMAERLAGGARATRIGQGFDAHRFGPGEAVWICGIKIAHDRALVGHSDADAGLHALTDALLGAIGEGDIGDHFPPSDPRWRGAASDIFLRHAADSIARRGGRVVNVDITLICEAPRIKPHREAMRARVAEILGVEIGRISVKATTTEGMGFSGRQEGLAAQAVAAVELPS